MTKANINYNCANIYFKPNELFHEEEWQEKFKGGQFNSRQGMLSIMIGKNYVLEMIGITIPTFGRVGLSSEKAIIESAKRIGGDFEDHLENYFGLVRRNIVEESLYFNENGFYDYSRPDQLGGKRITKWIKDAKDYPSDIESIFLEKVSFPKGFEIKFVPTFQALRDIKCLGSQNDNGYNIEGATLAKKVENFLDMYNVVMNHRIWIDRRANEIRFQQRQNNERINSRIIPIAEVIYD